MSNTLLLDIYIISTIPCMLVLSIHAFFSYKYSIGELFYDDMFNINELAIYCLMCLIPLFNIGVMIVTIKNSILGEMYLAINKKRLYDQWRDPSKRYRYWDTELHNGRYYPRYHQLYMYRFSDKIVLDRVIDHAYSFKKPEEAMNFIDEVIDKKCSKTSKIISIELLKRLNQCSNDVNIQ